MDDADYDDDLRMDEDEWIERSPPVYTQAEKQKMREDRIKRIMEQYCCSMEDALTFIDLREEGHSVYQASVMAGIADPNS